MKFTFSKFSVGFLAGTLFVIVVITILVCSSVFSLSKSLQDLVPANTFTEKVVERLVEKQYIKLINPMSREEMNDEIAYHLDYYISKYNIVIKNKKVTETILNGCLENDIPVNIGVALADSESSFDPNAWNNNGNSIDRGVYQLKNTSFPWLKKEDFYNIGTNVKYGLAFLKEKYITYNSWEIAVLLFNSGSVGNVGLFSLKHMVRVLNNEKKFDLLFFSFYKELRSIK